jgi:predicted kinase
LCTVAARGDPKCRLKGQQCGAAASSCVNQPLALQNSFFGSVNRCDHRITMSTPTLFVTVGLPGCGKTTAACQFEAEHAALRLTKDEWMKALYGAENPSWASDVIEGRLIAIALRALTLGINVALDFGLWSRDERSALRYAGAQAGASVVMWYAPITMEEQRRRHDIRGSTDPQATWPMSDEELISWAASFNVPTIGELDGTEPIDPPPAGFATWPKWMQQRWPLRVG